MADPGRFIHRITIEQDTGTGVNDANEHVPTWTPKATRWGRVEGVSGREFWQAKQVQSSVSHKIETWYVAGVTPAMRVRWGTRYLYIESVIADATQTEMVLMCSEVA